jgi:hypothetical protein
MPEILEILPFITGIGNLAMDEITQIAMSKFS